MADKKQTKTFNTKLHECCATDELRPLMQCIYFDNGFAYASNGHICIKQSLEYQSVLDPEELDGKHLHKDNYKAIMAFEFAECKEEGVRCWSANGQAAFFPYHPLAEDEKPINFESVLNPKKGITNLSFIGFNPEWFSKLTKAMYAPGGNIKVEFTGIDSAMLVEAIGIENQHAIIMPVILNDSLF